MQDKSEKLDMSKISEILDRGNTVEVKKTKDGLTILEVSRKIRYRGNDGDDAEQRMDTKEE
jgi:hypothetical protein